MHIVKFHRLFHSLIRIEQPKQEDTRTYLQHMSTRATLPDTRHGERHERECTYTDRTRRYTKTAYNRGHQATAPFMQTQFVHDGVHVKSSPTGGYTKSRLTSQLTALPGVPRAAHH